MALGRSESDLLTALAASGLAAPAKKGDKSELVDLGDEQLWLEAGTKDGVVRLQAKAKAKTKRKAASSTESAEESAGTSEESSSAKRPARKSSKKSAKN